MAALKHDPALTYTLEDFISMKISDDMTYYNFSILEVIDNVQHLSHNLIEDYLDDILELSMTVSLSDDEFRKYKHHPDILAYDLYGSVQLDFIILLLNDMIDPKEFERRSIKLPYASTISTVLNMIYSKEYLYINQNRAENNIRK